MALILDTTIGGEFSNSYVDTDYADDYFDGHFNTVKRDAWAALSDDQKEHVLIESAYVIEQFKFTVALDKPAPVSDLRFDTRSGRFVAYVGPFQTAIKYNYWQRLQFPRNLDLQTDGELFIPEKMKIAQCEQAVYLLSFDETPIANRLSGITLDRVQIDKIQATQEYSLAGTSLAPRTYDYIKEYLIKSSRYQRA